MKWQLKCDALRAMPSINTLQSESLLKIARKNILFMDGKIRTIAFIANLEAITSAPARCHVHDRLVRKNQRTDQTKPLTSSTTSSFNMVMVLSSNSTVCALTIPSSAMGKINLCIILLFKIISFHWVTPPLPWGSINDSGVV